jgi:hypothetical protein
MFGYGRGPAHFNAHTWVGLRVGLIVFQRTNISKMQKKIDCLVMGFRLTLKGMKLLINKPKPNKDTMHKDHQRTFFL